MENTTHNRTGGKPANIPLKEVVSSFTSGAVGELAYSGYEPEELARIISDTANDVDAVFDDWVYFLQDYSNPEEDSHEISLREAAEDICPRDKQFLELFIEECNQYGYIGELVATLTASYGAPVLKGV